MEDIRWLAGGYGGGGSWPTVVVVAREERGFGIVGQ